MKNHHFIAIALFGILLPACTQFTPYRTKTLTVDTTGSKPLVSECLVAESTPGGAPCESGESASYAIQLRRYQAWDKPECALATDEVEPRVGNLTKCDDGKQRERVKGLEYYLSVVEFDDQGWFADRRQMEALLALLKKIEQDNKEKQTNNHVLIYVYAHGWKHNASACDNNVVCFSRLLERTDLMERFMHDDK